MLMDLTIPQMQETLAKAELDIPGVPAHWDDIRLHVFYGTVYHGFLLPKTRHTTISPLHRAMTVTQEFQLYLKRLVLSQP